MPRKWAYRAVRINPGRDQVDPIAGMEHERAFNVETLLDYLDEQGWEVIASSGTDELLIVLRKAAR